ncbi:MAG TPA: lysylphosphatidylglycerol synthase transmembrane domain-containing protein [Polyangiaceae bacterium LLY-WYZ-14_1]|nr:lysylphosphatidylglycerol synthase transmembrane domain-containing protein [Polyangiaceae bacterium LLY-WYZ-14_1]
MNGPGKEGSEAEGSRRTLVAAPRPFARQLFGVVLLGALVFAALSAWSDVDALGDTLGRYAWEWFGVAVALATGNYALRWVRWELYLRRLAVRLPPGESAGIFLAGFVASITPGKLGEVYKSFLLHQRHGVSVAWTAPIVLAERVTDLLALVALTAFGALALRGGWIVALSGGVLVGLLLVASSVRSVGDGLLGLAARIPGVRGLEPRLREAQRALLSLHRPGTLLAASALSLVAWGLEVGSLAAVLAGFKPSALLPPAATSFAYAAPTIAGAAALLPGGLGVTEASMAAVLVSLSPAAGSAVASAATILVRLATLWWATVVGALALLALRLRPPGTHHGRRGARGSGGESSAGGVGGAGPST